MPSRSGARSSGKAARDEIGWELNASKLRRIGVAVVCGYVALVPLVFDPAADWPFTVPKALLSHALAYVLAAVLAGLLFRFGRATVPWSWLHVPVLLFLAANALATVFAVDPYVALFGTHSRMLGLGTIAAWTILYFAIVTVIRSRSEAMAVVAAALGGALLMLVYEVVQLLRLDPFQWNLDTATRPISTNGQATTLGSYLTVLALATFTLAVSARGARNRPRIALVIASATLLGGAALTGTRSSLIGVAAGATVLVGLLWMRSATSGQRKLTIATGGIGALAVLGVVLLTPVGGRLFQTAQVIGDSEEASLARLDTASLDVRAVLYRVAFDALRERPSLGYGPDNFVVAMTRHRPETGPNEARLAYATSAHGWVGQVAVGGGALGLAGFLGIIGTAVALTVRARVTAITCAAAVGLATFLGAGITTVSDVGSDWIFWLAAAFIALATAPGFSWDETHAATSRVKKGRRPRVRSWSIPEIVCLIAALAVVPTLIGPLQASRSTRSSQDTRLVGQVAPALRAGLDATARDPGRAEYWHALGLAYVASQRWPDASFALERAVQSAPWDARSISDLIQVELVLAQGGDTAARAKAVALSDDVVRADPNLPDAQIARATVMQFTGNNGAALLAVQRAMALLPQSTHEPWYVMAMQLYIAVGRPAEAIDVATSAISIMTPTVAVRTEFARALLASGRPQEALVQVDAILSVDPGNVSAKQLRSQIERALGR